MIYEFVALGYKPNTLGPVFAKLPESAPNACANGTLIGAFNCELGVLNRVAILSAYDGVEALTEDRAKRFERADPYGIAEWMSSYDQCAYKPLSYAPDIEVGAFGPFYEVRTYGIAHGGLSETEAAWAKVVPRRSEISRVLTVMGSIDAGPTRMMHIYPYANLDARTQARTQASKEGIWPPPGGSIHVTSLQSEMFSALKFSPLQ